MKKDFSVNTDNFTANELNLFNELIEKANKPESVGAFFPSLGERYFFLTGSSSMHEEGCDETKVDNYRIDFGNCFETQEKADWASKEMRKHNRLLAWVANHDDGWVADFSATEQRKYTVSYNEILNKYDFVFSTTSTVIGVISMSRQNAEELCRQLNAGEYEL